MGYKHSEMGVLEGNSPEFDREARQYNGPDLYAGASGGGHCESGVDVEVAILSVLAAFGVSFAILYMASTTNTGRKKRELTISDQISDVLWRGLEDFENKIDKIKIGGSEEESLPGWV